MTGRSGAFSFAAWIAWVGLGEVAHGLDADEVRPGVDEHPDLLHEGLPDRLHRGVAVGLEEPAARPHRGRDEGPAGDRPPHRLHRLAVDALLLGLEAVQRQAEGRAPEGVGGDQVGAGVGVQAGHLLDHLRVLEGDPLRGLPVRQPPLHELGAPRPVADQALSPLKPRQQPVHHATPRRPLTRSTAVAPSLA